MADIDPRLRQLLVEGIRNAPAVRHNRPQGRAMFISAVLRAIADELVGDLYSRTERSSFGEVGNAALAHEFNTGQMVR